jgi:hypothetical protein
MTVKEKTQHITLSPWANGFLEASTERFAP